MSHNVVPPIKSPAPPVDEATTMWKSASSAWGRC